MDWMSGVFGGRLIIPPTSMFAWGWNFAGQLGDGTVTDRHTPTFISTNWNKINARIGHHSLGIRSDGRLFAWGRNVQGQLGDGTITSRNIPTLIGTDTWIAISGGGFHSLGIR